MPLDDTAVAALCRADHGESLVVDGVACTGVFVLGVPQEVDDPAGIDRRRIASVRVATTVAISLRSQVRRVSDGTLWHVQTTPDDEYGEWVAQVVRAERHTEGRV